MSISLDFLSAFFGGIAVLIVAYIRYSEKKHFPIGDILTILFVGALFPVAIYYPFTTLFPYFPDLTQYITTNYFNPLYQVLIGIVLLRYLKDYINAELEDKPNQTPP